MTTAVDRNRMDELQWPRVVNKVITQKWTQLKNTLVMKDFVDYLIQRRVVTLDYWMGLKSKPITESERTEDFLSLVIKFDRQKYNYFLEALLQINRNDLVKDLVKAQTIKPKKFKPSQFNGSNIIQKPKRDTDHRPVSPTATKPENVKPIGQDTGRQGERTNTLQDTVTNPDKGDEPLVNDTANKVQSNSETTKTQNQSQDDTQKRLGQGSKGTAAELSSVQGPEDHQRALNHQNLMTGKLHHGIGTADDKVTTKKRHETSGNKQVTCQQDGPVQPLEGNAETAAGQDVSGRSDTQAEAGSVQSREDLLEMRETFIESKEQELKKREETLVEREKSLQRRETELLSRENTLVEASKTDTSEVGPLPIPKYLQNLIQDGVSRSTTASTTQSTDILVDVREQLAAMQKVNSGEIESEHTTVSSTPKDDYVKIEDLQAVQNDIELLKAEIATDRSSKQTLQEKVEDLKQEINELNLTIQKLENEKENMKLDQTRQINKLKLSIKNTTLNHNEGINSLKMQMKSKESECDNMKQNLDDIKKNAEELEKRVRKLENEKSWFEEEIKRYEREVSSLREQLEEKESVVNELRKTLEDTESEKEDLVEELADMKKEISHLKSEKKRLEQEKKTLLSRCVKPMWNQSSRRTPFQK